MATAWRGGDVDDDDVYRMRAVPRGICLIINNENFSDGSSRVGNDKDKAALKRTFTELGFWVLCYNDCTAREMETVLQAAAKCDHSDHDAFVCCIMSHGDRDVVLGVDGQGRDISRLSSFVKPSNCPSLKGKPKLFFVQACRGDARQTGYADSTNTRTTEESDFLVSYATVPGYVAFRRADGSGSAYMQHLAKLLVEHAGSEDVFSILTKVHRLVGREPDTQTPEFTSRLQKKLYLAKPVSVKFDPRSATPRHTHTVNTRDESDKDKPNIRSIVVIPATGHVCMADYYNNNIKVTSPTSPHRLSVFPLDFMTPWSIAHVSDCKLAITGWSNTFIMILDVSDQFQGKNRLQKIKTKKEYRGVDVVTENNTRLVVSCLDPASVDVISLTGELVRTVVSEQTVPELKRPLYLCVHSAHVFISDWTSHCVLQVEISSGKLIQTLKHDMLTRPCQVCTDVSGNVFIASFSGQCVLVLTTDGQWRQLLTGKQHGEGEYVCPWGVCVTQDGLMVSWWDARSGVGTVVKKYDMA